MSKSAVVIYYLNTLPPNMLCVLFFYRTRQWKCDVIDIYKSLSIEIRILERAGTQFLFFHDQTFREDIGILHCGINLCWLVRSSYFEESFTALGETFN